MKIYIEKLTIIAFLFYILPNLRKIKKKEIIYFSKYKYVDFLIFLCERINILKFSKYNLISDFYLDKNNECLLSSIFRKDLLSLKNYLINQKIFKFVNKNLNQDFYNYFLKNSYFGYNYLSPPVTLLLINKVYINNNKGETVLILKKRNFGEFYNNYASKKNIQLKYFTFLETIDIYKYFFYKNKSRIIIIYLNIKNFLQLVI